MNEIKYCYITVIKHANPVVASPDFQVEGHDAEGRLCFGFRTSDCFGWREKARSYTPKNHIAVFDRISGGI